MNVATRNMALIIHELIRAHDEKGDLEVEQRYIPRLKQLAEEMESGEFGRMPIGEQMGRLRAFRAEYLGRGEVFWLLSPKHIEPEYEQALSRCVQEYIDKLQDEA